MGLMLRLVGWLVLTWTGAAGAAQMTYETVLSALPIHAQGDLNVFATSFDYQNNQVFTVHVESAGSGLDGVNLQTVVRKGTRQDDARWTWENTVIESRTLLDPWHAQGSIALDKNGGVHVAYNMHNMPWQYSVSARPYDITSFKFKGQYLTQTELNTVKFENKTPFPELGSATIPGNQVTYPMFFKNKEDDLYVTYRYALKPARVWKERAFGAGIARYDTDTHTWRPIGGEVSISRKDAKLPAGPAYGIQKTLAYQDGYTVYLPTLGFDDTNTMHVFWNWRQGQAGMETTKPSYASSPDGVHFFNANGSQLTLPADYMRSISIEGPLGQGQFYPLKSVAMAADGSPMVIIQPLSGGRQLWRLDKTLGTFHMEKTPFSASSLVVDKLGREWAFASGLRVFMRQHFGAVWKNVGEIGIGLCYPQAKYYPKESRFLVHAKSCAGDKAFIYSFRH